MHISSDHAHGHSHSHPEQPPMTQEEVLKLLSYMLDHNRQHTEELHDLFHTLNDAGCDEAADELDNAVRYYSAGNEALATALDLAKEAAESEE